MVAMRLDGLMEVGGTERAEGRAVSEGTGVSVDRLALPINLFWACFCVGLRFGILHEQYESR